MNDASRYDALLEAGREPPPPCPICTGEDAEPCSEECDALVRRVRRERQIACCRDAIEIIEKMIARYGGEGSPGDVRVRVCRDRIAYYEDQISKLEAA